jgi:LCP family protein required for cell wall assembly
VLWTAVGLAVAVIATSSWLYHHVTGKIRSVDINAELGADRPAPAEETGGGQSILVVGNDSGAEELTAQDALPAAGSATVVHLPGDHSSPTAVNIPHDMPVPRPRCAGADEAAEPPAELPFHAVHTMGGPSCVVHVVERMSGIRMDHYIEVDFAGFGGLVNALGGLTVTTAAPIQDARTGLELPPGAHELNGEEAMAALRAAGPETQQHFLLALIEEINDQDVLGSPAKLYRVADAAAGSLTTDSGLGSISGLIGFARELSAASTDSLKVLALPAEAGKADPVWARLR